MAEAADRQVGFLWAAVVLALLLLAPLAPFVASQLWSCPFKSLIGIPCPTCGTTRAALSLARLDVLGALVRYPLPTIGWVLFMVGGAGAGWLAWRNRPLPALKPLPLWAKVGLVSAVLANWLYSIATGV